MAEIKTTRLRYITASSKEELIAAVESLQFRVEIKEIVREGAKKWSIFFVLPEISTLKFQSTDLTT